MDSIPPVLSSLDPYELGHLPTHLASCDRDDDLHALLALDEKTNHGMRNAWFLAKESIGDGQGYADDIALAGRVAASRAATTIGAGATAAEIGLEVRYAMVRASLTTLTVNLPGEFLVELVKNERWTIQHALANARLQPGAWARGRALAMLSDFVEEGEQRRALEEALASVAAITPDESEAWQSRNKRASLLGVLTRRLPVDLLETAIERAREIDDASERASALSELAGRLDADGCQAVLRDALDALANGTRSEPFQLLAAIVPAELVGELIDAARAIEHPYQRSAALIGVIDLLSPNQRDAVLAAIQADTKLQDDQRPRLLATAARYLSREQLHQLVDAVRAIEWDSGRIEIWPTLVPALPPMIEPWHWKQRSTTRMASMRRPHNSPSRTLPPSFLSFQTARPVNGY
jgi:hypothetical protein